MGSPARETPCIAGPVAIGGLPGSGTRLAAYLVREFGIYIGDDLTDALDNLWFGLLLASRPAWHRAHSDQASVALRVFEKVMRGHPSFDQQEERAFDEALHEWHERPFRHVSPENSRRIKHRLSNIGRTMRSNRGIPDGAIGWGWKSPNSFIFLEQLADVFPELKYIHVMRNGLDLLGKTKMHDQVQAWRQIFDIQPPEAGSPAEPKTALSYWIRANQRVLKLGPELFEDRFFVLRYETACEDPRRMAQAVGEFLGVPSTPAVAEAFSAFAGPPDGGDNSAIIRQLDPAELAQVESLGFAIGGK